MIERIAEVVRDKTVEGISDLRDESDRDGVRVVIELKRDAMRRGRPQPAVPLHAAADQFRRQHAGTEQRQAGDAEPEGEVIAAFVEFREEVITRRTDLRSGQGARPGPRPGRACHRGRQHRRGDRPDPPPGSGRRPAPD